MNETEAWETCKECEGSGLSRAGATLETAVCTLLNAPWDGKNDGYQELTTRLAEREPHPKIGHDVIDIDHVAKRITDLAELPRSWRLCKTCNGAGCVAKEEKH